LIVVVLGFPVFIIGALINLIPFGAAHAMGMFSKMSLEFRHAVRIASAIGTYLLWIICLIYLVAKINAWFIPIICILVPILSWLSIRYIDYYSSLKKWSTAFGKPIATIDAAKMERTKLIERLLEKKLWV